MRISYSLRTNCMLQPLTANLLLKSFTIKYKNLEENRNLEEKVPEWRNLM